MAKSVYSLLLSDEIITAIDDLAVRQGRSRSALVNHILAEYACLSTPEKRMQDIVSIVEEIAGHGGLRTQVSPGGALTLRTALRYKYNPAVFYVLELTENEETSLGNLRIGSRSQNEDLLDGLQEFFTLWDKLEHQYLPNPPAIQVQKKSSNSYARPLRRPANGTGEQIGQAIASYISAFDNCIKAFFDYADDLEQATQVVEQSYTRLLPTLGDAKKL